ncbi:LacI family DNA-binding transcriptional regulator [Microbacter margulisiae]|uniref:LacI family transcriptional regulator n=1 Tax=Microbacter margulisiae TaxID=1350067 RepID=A0A7W5DU48_9PORP|nr:LacI family DNA-binding transcriptional regulator [Microbacter margulisiae]MBB3188263.1 LacI family transcriptional regulator [Microbacter margulisiae]
MQGKPTIKDIAKALNIHHTTVSRALRGDSRIKEETCKKVKAYAASIGYVVDQNAVNLRNKTINNIAVIVPNISHNIFSSFIGLITEMADKEGLTVSVFQSKEQFDLEAKVIKTIVRHRVGGVIASVSNETQNGKHFEPLKKFGIPLVFFDRVCEDMSVSKVLVNNYEGAGKAVDYLIEKGYRRIAHLTGRQSINVFRDRHKGYLDGIDRAGLTYRASVSIEKDFEIFDGENAIQNLWNQKEKPDAIFSDSFILSAGVIKQCRQLGIHLPDELGMLTITNDPFSNLILPHQTVMEQPLAELAASSFDLLMKAMKGEQANVHSETRYHAFRMIERDSVRTL